MNTKYLIEEQTLKDIADSIREMDGSDDAILVEEYASRIGSIEPTTEEYMRITDHLNYPELINEANYTQEEIMRCTELYKFYLEMEDEI